MVKLYKKNKFSRKINFLEISDAVLTQLRHKIHVMVENTKIR